MLFVKKFLMGFGAFLLILVGGAGIQSQSTLLQGTGFIGLIIALIVLYIFAKMAWRAMGCLPSILIVFAVLFFIFYAIGIFNGGVKNIIPNFKSFLGQTVSSVQDSVNYPDVEINNEEKAAQAPILENFSSPGNQQPKQQATEKSGFLDELFSSRNNNNYLPNPRQLPVIYSNVRVVSGDTLIINGRYLRIFGIDAPESNQTCADNKGQSYHCGKYSSSWLRNWLQDNEVECRILKQDSKGNMVGICFLGEYDIGAAIVNSGWAVVYANHSSIYVPYQLQAQKNKDGLWQGKFYMPWDWRKIQARKPKIKIINKKPKRKRTFLNPLG